jgi:hypothetical protein
VWAPGFVVAGGELSWWVRRGRLAGGRWVSALAVLPLAAAGLVAQAGVAGPALAATSTFIYTGLEQTYTVPAGVSAVTITAVGAPGGAGNPVAPGGKGASVTATVAVTAGATLYVLVGGPGVEQTDAGPTVGGFNGGGSSDAGGGGGASDVRSTSASTGLTPTSDSRLGRST